MNRHNKIQKLLEDALLVTLLSGVLGKIPLAGPLLAKLVAKALSGMVANIMSEQAFLATARLMSQILLQKAQEDAVDPKCRKWLQTALEQMLESMDMQQLLGALEQLEKESASYPIGTTKGERGSGDEPREEEMHEAVTGGYAGITEESQAMVGAGEKQASMGEALREGWEQWVIEQLEKIDAPKLAQEAEDEAGQEVDVEEAGREIRKAMELLLGRKLEEFKTPEQQREMESLLERKLREELTPLIKEGLRRGWSDVLKAMKRGEL